ncbi:hypothetical protein EDD86DRAFT_276892 [Gorgonomyces haynaldii]|nr:hypothetical protein EDD86DRAFT_276892 [Gorgonomyces haynaldii]
MSTNDQLRYEIKQLSKLVNQAKKKVYRPSRNVQLIKEQDVLYRKQGNSLVRVPPREIVIRGIVFEVNKRLLVRVRGEGETPDQLVYNKTNYVKTSDGNLISVLDPEKSGRPICEKWLLGMCPMKECRYRHEGPHGCVKYQRKKFCDRPNCDQLHVQQEHTRAWCTSFNFGKCKNLECSFLHVSFPLDALVCPFFVKEGFCRLGEKCPKKHLFTCPDFDSNGSCQDPECHLPHYQRKEKQESIAAQADIVYLDD